MITPPPTSGEWEKTNFMDEIMLGVLTPPQTSGEGERLSRLTLWMKVLLGVCELFDKVETV